MVSSEDSAWDVPPSIFGTRSGGPTVQRLVLGSQLHRLREARRITAEQAAEAIRGSHSKISRMEHGRVGFKERDVGDLLTLYGVTDSEERAALLNLAREANTPGWASRRRRQSSGPIRSSSCPGCCRPRATPAR
jgi:Helix-turn-helix domain